MKQMWNIIGLFMLFMLMIYNPVMGIILTVMAVLIHSRTARHLLAASLVLVFLSFLAILAGPVGIAIMVGILILLVINAFSGENDETE